MTARKYQVLCKRGHELTVYPRTGGGTRRKCKTCLNALTSKYRNAKRQNPTEYRKFLDGLSRKARENRTDAVRERERIWAANKRQPNPQKVNARSAVYRALKSGKIKKPVKCDRCGAQRKLQGHHFAGYDKPLMVRWLCGVCHKAEHPWKSSNL